MRAGHNGIASRIHHRRRGPFGSAGELLAEASANQEGGGAHGAALEKRLKGTRYRNHMMGGGGRDGGTRSDGAGRCLQGAGRRRSVGSCARGHEPAQSMQRGGAQGVPSWPPVPGMGPFIVPAVSCPEGRRIERDHRDAADGVLPEWLEALQVTSSNRRPPHRSRLQPRWKRSGFSRPWPWRRPCRSYGWRSPTHYRTRSGYGRSVHR